MSRSSAARGEFVSRFADGVPRTFGDLLKDLRLASGLTQEALAERAGISARAVSDLERGGGRTPRLETIRLLAEALGLSAEQRRAFIAAGRKSAVPAPQSAPGLPIPPTTLVGRDALLQDLIALLSEHHSRLVTLTGTGGVGKTRVALAAAGALQDHFADGSVFVPLGSLRDPDLVTTTIAATLGLGLATGESPADSLRAALGPRHQLLVLDNFEHLLEAGPNLADLLAACPRLRLLVTSRAPLRLRGEREVHVPCLGVPESTTQPDLESVGKSDAVRLFVERARDVRPGFGVTPENAAAIAAICRRLDGLPLALELAATRMRVRDADALLALLSTRLPVLTGGARDAPARQRTLRDTIDWSYGLLTFSEQQLLRRLSVFRSACSFQAAATVCDLDGSTAQAIPQQLESLTAQSLLVCNAAMRDGSKFSMPETIREFASDRLVQSGEADAIAGRHAAWCLDLAEASARDLMGPSQPDVFARLEAQHDDIRAALEWMNSHHQPEMLARLVGAMCWFWALRTHYAEGARWAATALSMTLSPQGRAEALFAAGLFAWYQTDLERARRLGEECLASRRASGDAHGEAQALILLGQVASDAGKDAAARPLLEQALKMGRELEDTLITGQALYRLGWVAEHVHDHARAQALHMEGAAVSHGSGNLALEIMLLAQAGRSAMERGDYAAARACFMEGVTLNARTGDPLRKALLSASRGELARRSGMPREARQHLDDALDVLRNAPDRRITALALDSLARLLLQLGELEDAGAHAEDLLALRRQFGNADRLADCLVLLGDINLRQGNRASARAYVEEALSVTLRARDPRTLVRCLDLAGALAAEEEDDMRAAQLWGAAEARRRLLTDTCSLADNAWTEVAINASRMRLGATAWAAAVRTGESMLQEQVIAYALGA